MNNNNSKKEDFGACGSATSAIPSKISYMGIEGTKKNEIYYFGNPPKKPDSLSNFLKKNKNNKG